MKPRKENPWIGARHIALDIETLDITPNAVITEVGLHVCQYTPDDSVIESIEAEQPLQYNVSWVEQLRAGRSISKDTVQFHIKQGTIQRIVDNKFDARITPLNLLMELKSVIKKTDYIWCKTVSFDIGTLQSLFDQHGLTVPWSYRNVDELRTLVRAAQFVSGRDEKTFYTEHSRHVAGADAKAQTKAMLNALSVLDAAYKAEWYTAQ